MILVLNCGFSSIKFALFDASRTLLDRKPLWSGKVDSITGSEPTFGETGVEPTLIALDPGALLYLMEVDIQCIFPASLVIEGQDVSERLSPPPDSFPANPWAFPGGRMHPRGIGQHTVQVEGGAIEAIARNDDDITVIDRLGLRRLRVTSPACRACKDLAQFAQPQHRVCHRCTVEPIAKTQAHGREGLLQKWRIYHRHWQQRQQNRCPQPSGILSSVPTLREPDCLNSLSRQDRKSSLFAGRC